MRPSCAGVLTLVTVALFIATPGAQAPPRPALDRLAKARTALGGEAELAAVRTLRLVVHDRDRLGTWFPDRVTAARFEETRGEVRILLPDHFMVGRQASTLPMPSRPWGFAGHADTRASATSRAILGHLMLALLLRTDTVFQFTLKDVTGDTLRFADPFGEDVLVELDPVSSQPRRIRYDEVLRDREGEPTGQRRPRRVELGAYAPVGGLRLPHTRTTYQGETLLQERRFETIDMNPQLAKSDFK